MSLESNQYHALNSALEADAMVDEMAIVPELSTAAAFEIVVTPTRQHKLALRRSTAAQFFACGALNMRLARGDSGSACSSRSVLAN